VQSNGGRTPRTAPQKEPVSGRRSSVANYQGGESFLEKAAGAVRELHLGALREGQRLETLGNGADEARWKEREETGTGGSSAKAGILEERLWGDGRGLGAGGVRGKEIGRLTDTKEGASKKKSKGAARKTERQNEKPRTAPSGRLRYLT